MVGFESELMIENVDVSDVARIGFMLSPCLYADRQRQRLFVLVNDIFVGEFVMTANGHVSCDVAALPPSSDMIIRFVHPDAFAAASIGDHGETRMLSCALLSLELGGGRC